MKNIPDNQKYDYLITTCAKSKEIWLLKVIDDVYAMLEDGEGQEYLAVWPEKQYAELLCKDDWYDYLPEKMKIYEFINWTKELENDKVLIAAFPGEDMKVIPINPLDFKNHLENEIKAK